MEKDIFFSITVHWPVHSKGMQSGCISSHLTFPFASGKGYTGKSFSSCLIIRKNEGRLKWGWLQNVFADLSTVVTT